MTHEEVFAAVQERPHSSARDVAVTLGLRTGKGNVAIVRGYLERLETTGHVQRTRSRPNSPWLWEARQGASTTPAYAGRERTGT